MTTTTTEPSENEQREHELTEAAANAVSTLFDVGRLWAAHGLGVGRCALNASAQTLRVTANLLGDLSETFEGDDSVDEEQAEEAA